MHRRAALRRLGLMAALLLAGCAQGPRNVAVTGRVYLDGVPLKDVMVNLSPVSDTIGSGALAAADESGRFTLMDVRGQAGIYPGEYKISLYPATPAPKDDDPADVVATPARGNLPGIYLSANDSPVRVTVPETGGNLDIRLTRSGEGASARFVDKLE